MSRERLQEHFSALYEGTLDKGLTQQIQRRFEADSQLKADYDQFCMTMNSLGGLQDEVIEVPSFLSSRIADRLDTAVSAKPAFSLFNWSKALSFGALATTAIVASVLALNSRSSGPVEAGIIKQPEKVVKLLDTVQIQMKGRVAQLTFNSSGPKTIITTFYGTNEVLHQKDLNGDSAVFELANPQVEPAIFEVSVTGSKENHFVVVPGSTTVFDMQGSGKLSEFLKGISTQYRKVLHVQMTPEKLAEQSKWDIKGTEANNAISSLLTSKDYAVSTAPDGVISIDSNH